MDVWIFRGCIFFDGVALCSISLSLCVLLYAGYCLSALSRCAIPTISKHRHTFQKNELFITDLDNSTIGLQGVLNRMMNTIEHQDSDLHHHLIQELQLDPKFYGKSGGLFLVVVGCCGGGCCGGGCCGCLFVLFLLIVFFVYFLASSLHLPRTFLASSLFFLTLTQACGGSPHCWPVNLTCRTVCGCGIPSLLTSTKRNHWSF